MSSAVADQSQNGTEVSPVASALEPYLSRREESTMSFIEPDLVVNNPSAASNNSFELSTRLTNEYINAPSNNKGAILLLPKGKIYMNTVHLTDAHRGLVIQG